MFVTWAVKLSKSSLWGGTSRKNSCTDAINVYFANFACHIHVAPLHAYNKKETWGAFIVQLYNSLLKYPVIRCVRLHAALHRPTVSEASEAVHAS